MISSIIIDDEHFALKALQYRLSEFPQIEVQRAFLHREFSIKELLKIKPQVIFLDIEMSNLNGIHLAEKIKSILPNIHIVFVTAHANYAVQAFELNSLDYLLKPVSSLRLKKTIQRIESLFGSPTPKIVHTEYTIQCFKEFQLFVQKQPISFKTAKVKELFAYFIMHHSQPVQRDILIETLWPMQDFKRAKTNLHTSISHLRKLLASLGYQDAIKLINTSYILEIDNFQTDFQQLELKIERIKQTNYTKLALVNMCIDLYKGHLFELDHYDWAHSYTRHFQHLFSSMLIETLQQNTLIKDRALVYIRLLQSILPLEDEIVLFLIQQYLKYEHRIEATQLFNRYKDFLQHELHLKPSESLCAFFNEKLKT